MRIATYNVENLFSRARALAGSESAENADVLDIAPHVNDSPAARDPA